MDTFQRKFVKYLTNLLYNINLFLKRGDVRYFYLKGWCLIKGISPGKCVAKSINCKNSLLIKIRFNKRICVITYSNEAVDEI